MKITIIGAGNVGATCADVMARKELANEIILLDIVEGMAEGKALDMWETAPVDGTDTRVVGVTNDYSKTKGSDVVVITSGVPRKPGMSRDDLIGTNAKIVKDVTEKAVEQSPDAIILVVANPLDVMSYTASLVTKKSREKVFGMAGILDTSRFKAFISEELNVSTRDIQTLLLGGHGDTMVPLPSYTTISGIPLTQFLDKEKIDALVKRTRGGGGEIVKLQGTSAWYAPGAAVAQMVESILRDQNRIVPVCVELKGEYGMKDVFLGVPVKLGKGGIKEVIEIDLTDEEMKLLTESSNAVKNVMGILDKMNLF